MKTSRRTWYITLTAIYYLLICSATSLFYLTQHLLPNPAIIPRGIQFLCLATALSSALYFANPRLGHRCLIATTVLTLIAIGESDIHATGFHLTVLAILLLPFLLNRKEISTGQQPSDLPRTLA